MQREFTPTPEVVALYWAKVDKNGPTPEHCPELGPCWLWTAFRLKGGYGQVMIEKWPRKAHRVAWILKHGAIPIGVNVLHRCDNTSCVNDDHLFLGTIADNNADKVAKGRQARGPATAPKNPARGERNGLHRHPEAVLRGEAHGSAKLTAEIVSELRRRYAGGGVTIRHLAREMGVPEPNATAIIHRRTWRHVA